MKKIYTITQTRTQTQTNKDLDIVSIPQYEDHEKQQPHKHSRKHKQTYTQMHKQTRTLILYKEYHEKQTLRIKEASVNHKTWKSRGAKVMLACCAILKGLFCSLFRWMYNLPSIFWFWTCATTCLKKSSVGSHMEKHLGFMLYIILCISSMSSIKPIVPFTSPSSSNSYSS